MELIHVLSRGVDKRKIFMDDQDYFRFIHDLFEFNDQAPVSTIAYNNFQKYKYDVIARRQVVFEEERKPRKLLVNLHTFCLMPNHYHLLLNARVESGVSKFMKKLNMGYARYFNERYKRQGTLFEGRYKSVPIKSDAHFIHLPYYIHLNPLDIISPEWRNRELKNFPQAIQFLNSYRWSSHLDYAGIKNFPSVTQRDFLMKFFGSSNEYKKSIKKWLKTFDLERLENLLLEK